MFLNVQFLHLHSAAGTKFKMKILAVCLMAAALVGMGASTTLENIAGETADVVEGEEAFSSMVLREGSSYGPPI